MGLTNDLLKQFSQVLELVKKGLMIRLTISNKVVSK